MVVSVCTKKGANTTKYPLTIRPKTYLDDYLHAAGFDGEQ